MNSSALSTWLPILILLVIVVVLVRRLIAMLRYGRNQVRQAMGKETAEVEKAQTTINKYSKNNLIPKWAAQDAIDELKKYYTASASIDAITKVMQNTGLRHVDFPRKLYIEPGATREQLIQACLNVFESFGRDIDHKLTDKENEQFNGLVAMWYFADNDVSTLEEARKNVNMVFLARAKHIVDEHNAVHTK